MSAPPTSSVAARLLSVAAPLAAAVGVYAAANAPAPHPVDASDPTSPARSLITAVSEAPEVLVVGNSQAGSGIDTVALGAALGADTTAATIGGATGPFVWTLLRHRVFRGERPPRLLIVAMSPAHLLDVRPTAETLRPVIDHLLTGPDPVVTSLGLIPSPLDRALGEVRTARDRVLAAWTALPGDGWLGEGAMEAARQRVLGSFGGAQFATQVDAIPAATRATAAPAETDTRTVPEAVIELAHEAGTRVVFVFVPQHIAAWRTPNEEIRELGAWLIARGAGVVFAEQTPLPTDAWADSHHLGPRGRVAFTADLGRALVAMHALGPEPLQQGELPPPPPTLTRTATPTPVKGAATPTQTPCLIRLDAGLQPWQTDAFFTRHALTPESGLTMSVQGTPLRRVDRPSLTRSCDGTFYSQPEGSWVGLPEGASVDQLTVGWTDTANVRMVEPGAAWSATWEDPPTGDHLRVLVQTFDADTTPSLHVDGAPLALSGWGALRYAEVPLTAPLRAVEVRSNRPAYVRQLSLVRGGQITMLLDDPDPHPAETSAARAIDLSAKPQMARATFASAGAAVDGEVRFAVDAPHTGLTLGAIKANPGPGLGPGCTPFALGRANGAIVPGARVLQVHAGEVVAKLPAGEDPAGPWTLVTSAHRTCKRSAWIQPGETFELRFATGGAPVPLDRLDLQAWALPPTASPVHLTVYADKQRLAEVDLPGGASAVPLPPVPSYTGPIRLVVTAPADAWLVVRPPTLRATTPPPDAWFVAGEAPPPAAHADATEPP